MTRTRLKITPSATMPKMFVIRIKATNHAGWDWIHRTGFFRSIGEAMNYIAQGLPERPHLWE